MSDASDAAFREMSEADQSRTEVVNFSCGEERWHIELNESIRTGKALRHGAKGKQATFLWCLDGGKGEILGYACIRRRDFEGDPTIPSLLITELALDHRHQHKGHGTRMLEEVKRFGASDGAKIIELFVHEHNAHAIGLYERRGFEFLQGRVWVDPDTGDRYPAMICIL